MPHRGREAGLRGRPLLYSAPDFRGCSSVGRARRSQRRGQRFDPAHLHHFIKARLCSGLFHARERPAVAGFRTWCAQTFGHLAVRSAGGGLEQGGLRVGEFGLGGQGDLRWLRGVGTHSYRRRSPATRPVQPPPARGRRRGPNGWHRGHDRSGRRRVVAAVPVWRGSRRCGRGRRAIGLAFIVSSGVD